MNTPGITGPLTGYNFNVASPPTSFSEQFSDPVRRVGLQQDAPLPSNTRATGEISNPALTVPGIGARLDVVG